MTDPSAIDRPAGDYAQLTQRRHALPAFGLGLGGFSTSLAATLVGTVNPARALAGHWQPSGIVPAKVALPAVLSRIER